MKDLNQQRLLELLKIKKEHGGLLKAEDVVEFAREPDVALHSWFEWDDSIAAQNYRLIQARSLINVMIAPSEHTDHAMPVFVSLLDDRQQPGGGYRSLEEVMGDPELRQKALRTALIELSAFRKRYKELSELVDVFAEIEKAEQKYAAEESPA